MGDRGSARLSLLLRFISGRTSKLAGTDWLEAAPSPRPHWPAQLSFLIGTSANTEVPVGPAPASCPLGSRKEQSLRLRPPPGSCQLRAVCTAHTAASWAPVWGRNRRADGKSGLTRWPSCSFNQRCGAWGGGQEGRLPSRPGWLVVKGTEPGSGFKCWPVGSSDCDPGPGCTFPEADPSPVNALSSATTC